ncbi:MAG: sugar ABC transporter permease [Bacilli bacterium]|nr:sugar ABC transporter permease [Bacilli bacterium]
MRNKTTIDKSGDTVIELDPKRKRHLSLNVWGPIFLVPFFVIFIIFQIVPLAQTFYYSFFSYYKTGSGGWVGPTFSGWDNFAAIFAGYNGSFWKYLGNTMLLWIIGAIPQFAIALLLAVWFTDTRLKIRGQPFFKAVIYMPNLVMASALGYLMLAFSSSDVGPLWIILRNLGIIGDTTRLLDGEFYVRLIVIFMNVLLWLGNTMLLLMSGIMGIDDSIFESARLDGASSWRTFRSVTFPLLLPIFIYVFITSLIGGMQLFDTVYIFTNEGGGPNQSSYTIMMWLRSFISTSKNYGMAGALSVVLFIITGILSVFVFRTMTPHGNAQKQEIKSRRKRKRWLRMCKNYGEGFAYERSDID